MLTSRAWAGSRALTSQAQKPFDVVIAGGGVIGSSVAYFLATESLKSGGGGLRIAVVEKDPTYRYGMTGRSAGSIRAQFSTKENIQMSLFGFDFLKSVGELLAVDGVAPGNVTVRENGYLFLASPDKRTTLEENCAVQIENGADTRLLTPTQMRAQFPWIVVSDDELGGFGASKEGWFDPTSLLTAFKKKAASLGVTYMKDEVVGLTLNAQKTAVNSVSLKGGDSLGCNEFINCSGTYASVIAKMIGEKLPVYPRKRCIWFTHTKDPAVADTSRIPLVIDPSGVYFRPEGTGFITGVSPTVDPDAWDDFDVDHSLFEDVVWPALVNRVPAFETLRVGTSWCGHYAYNTFDQNLIIGRHPTVRNFVFANGCSGHGLQHSPAVGRAISELIFKGGYKTIDLTRFSFERLAANKPIIEKNVV